MMTPQEQKAGANATVLMTEAIKAETVMRLRAGLAVEKPQTRLEAVVKQAVYEAAVRQSGMRCPRQQQRQDACEPAGEDEGGWSHRKRRRGRMEGRRHQSVKLL